MESIAPPTKSPPGSPMNEDRVPHATPSIASIFPPNSSGSGGSASDQTIPQYSNSISIIFPPTKSEIFPPTKSESESSESNQRFGQSQIVGEVLRIKEILYNSEDESDSVLLESLRKLQLMVETVDTLKATAIGKAVNRLRKHASKEIRHLAWTLIEYRNIFSGLLQLIYAIYVYWHEIKGWKDMVDQWINATQAIAVVGLEGTPDSVNPSVVDEEEEEEGLPSPPLDEGAFFATQPIATEVSQVGVCMVR
uniref:TFIIS N-terminal domain-containing protein n=1 Tax=Quercus lobata TaxID=97700 RepID=A0A7N2R0W6_QUELO